MDWTIASILAVDGLTNGAVYALVAIALVLVFAVTRVVFIPQGEFVAFGALTMALFQAGRLPGTVWLLLGLVLLVAALDGWQAWRRGWPLARWARQAVPTLLPALLAVAAAAAVAGRQVPMLLHALLTLALITPMGPLLYRVAYRSLAHATVLVLLIVSVGVHFALTGLGLVAFGAEGFRNPGFLDLRLALGPVTVTGQALIVLMVALALIAGLFLFFGRTLTGKALRATSVNRTGARLMGISSDGAGALSFAMAAFIGALSGLLIGPSTTVFYDTGFLIGLKGFVAAVFGGLGSFPLALVGAVGVGLVESFASFWQSALKEAIVFTVILPVLMWRSFIDPHVEEH
ncbi:branched-chain amino acid ABC transporter permease [Ideonella sp. BN130291]|uniref:branched-chain amino acid ABC transporter permease n=1 Tax=Ideonella sp. BN130291 TaxID=3112940 RepID=UPI002E257999|nr:branched-chain amino acid ABC transporter permease [Ideonella sp. BN130291]